MQTKDRENLITDLEIYEALEIRAKAEFKNPSSMLAQGVHTCYVTPANIVKVMTHLLTKEPDREGPPGPQKKTSITLSVVQSQELERLAGRLGISKNALLNIVAKGLLLGII